MALPPEDGALGVVDDPRPRDLADGDIPSLDARVGLSPLRTLLASRRECREGTRAPIGHERYGVATAAFVLLLKPLYLFVPVAVLFTGGRERWRQRTVAGIVLVAAATVALLVSRAGYIPPRPDTPDTVGTAAAMLASPLDLAELSIRDLVENAGGYRMGFVGILGWLDALVPETMSRILFVALLFILAVESQGLEAHPWVRIASLRIARLGQTQMREKLNEVPLFGAPLFEEPAELFDILLSLFREYREAVVGLFGLAHADHFPLAPAFERAAHEGLRFHPWREEAELDPVARGRGHRGELGLRERIRLLEENRAVRPLAQRFPERRRLVLEPDERQTRTIDLHEAILVLLQFELAANHAAPHRVLLLLETEPEHRLRAELHWRRVSDACSMQTQVGDDRVVRSKTRGTRSAKADPRNPAP